ncbi:restriction endonuclease subunit S [Clostridium fermenticellae]|uniref:Restriction endonuclease subunit S n=1 Tax=Clostridium fermenticellae TaxID=2068654 RepID=A0A386H524_9CLOT|nr:restriction endonuclease subunit S [Clostridium fermenticellae]AYD40809.1 restriction endonuclease subunit S [Clostridium fermenticellae]
MENSWIKYKIGDICEVRGGKRLPKGATLLNKKTIHPYIRLVDIYGNRINEDNIMYIAENVYKKISRYIVNKDDVCVAIVGNTIGMVFYVDKRWDGSNLTENAVKIVCNNQISSKYLFYYLNSIYGQNEINKGIVGSAQGKLPIYNVKNIEIYLPNKFEQNKIVSILSSFDDKIELNNEMNKTLEEMAQAIFKSWFVDFEPFKEVGFEESELGMIPKGWKILELSKLGNIVTGKTPSKNNPEHFGKEYKFITPKDINGNIFITKSERGLSNEGYEKMKKNMHYKYSIGVSCIGSDLGEVYLNDDEGFTNQQINTLTLNNYKYYPYVYICLKNMKDDFKNMASGSAVPIINKTAFSKIKIVVPSEKYIEDFYNKVDSIFRKMLININQNEELNETRDTLLPKLISGKIRLND